MSESDTSKTKNPLDFDKNTGDRVEKAPKGEESPQQTHDNEDQG
jgi:hypothetical protein